MMPLLSLAQPTAVFGAATGPCPARGGCAIRAGPSTGLSLRSPGRAKIFFPAVLPGQNILAPGRPPGMTGRRRTARRGPAGQGRRSPPAAAALAVACPARPSTRRRPC
jgi:hypothetical protein